MIKKIICTAAICCVLFAGCESAKIKPKPKPQIKSIADKTFSRVIKKMFFVIQLPDTGWAELISSQNEEERTIANHELFRKTIINYFNGLDVETESEILTGREKNDYELNDKMAAFTADAVCTIHAISYNRKESLLNEIVFDVSIFDEISRKRIWKANWIMTTSDPDTGERKADGKSIADSLYEIVTNQLKADGMDVFRQF